jgi:hypothetical protein
LSEPAGQEARRIVNQPGDTTVVHRLPPAVGNAKRQDQRWHSSISCDRPPPGLCQEKLKAFELLGPGLLAGLRGGGKRGQPAVVFGALCPPNWSSGCQVPSWEVRPTLCVGGGWTPRLQSPGAASGNPGAEDRKCHLGPAQSLLL